MRKHGICPLQKISLPVMPRRGTWYPYLRGKSSHASMGPSGAMDSPHSSIRMHNRASTIWYHDHALGMTRLNVYAGPAGFYIIRGGPAGDAAVLDTRSGTTGCAPRPGARRQDDPFPPHKTYYEIPIAIQDRAFNNDGSLFYPDTRANSSIEYIGPYLPRDGYLPDLEPGVLRQHDHGQRQHLALPDRRTAPLPLPFPERLPVPLPDPGLLSDPRCGSLADRQRGRLPGAPVNHHCGSWQSASHGFGGARRHDRGLHQCASWQLRAGQFGPRRALRRR